MNTHLARPMALVFFVATLFSCLKDTDFEQAELVALTPIVELDLIYFTLTAPDFFDSIANTPIVSVVDTTEIRFLDDNAIQENLKRAEFLFNFKNSIPRTFQVDFQFLSEQNDTAYTTQTMVNEGTIAQPETTLFSEIVEEEEIQQLTQANKVVVTVTIPSADASLEGSLNLKSKTTYFLEIND
jgi:hypothetical protein